MTAARDATIADLRAENAALRAERDAAATRHESDYSERIAHQAATIEVLKVLSAAPGDPRPLFDLIVRKASLLCDSTAAALYEYDGLMLHCRFATISKMEPERTEAFLRQFPRPLDQEPDHGATVAIRERRIVHIRDAETEGGLSAASRRNGIRSAIAIPLIRAGAVAGVIALGDTRPGGYTDSQVELLKTFAEQAVIAIASAETSRALQTRTADLQRSLEYQTATSDLLKVVSRSTSDLQPVLETVVETAARLCGADIAVVARVTGDTMQVLASVGESPEYAAHIRALRAWPFDRNGPAVTARAVVEGRVVHVHDTAAIPGYPKVSARLGKQRTALGVPLMRDGEPIGVILLARQRVEPFADQQIELVRTFADQAVIAIENARLLTEQREALERQTATAEVLQVINASPGNLVPVFDAVLEKAHDLCGALFGGLLIYDGESAHLKAHRNLPPAWVEWLGVNSRVDPSSPMYRLVQGERLIQIEDLQAVAEATDDPRAQAGAELGGIRTLLLIPLRKEDTLLAIITAYRPKVQLFSAKQIALLESFAAQAVIAMENARLLEELRDRTAELAERNDAFAERIDHQATTIDVLKAMSASPGDPQPVFDLIVRRAQELCNGARAALFEYDGTLVHYRAAYGAASITTPEALAAYRRLYPMAPTRSLNSHRAILDKKIVHVRDMEADPESVEVSRALGFASEVLLPLMRDGEAVGVIGLVSMQKGGFSDSQIELLKTFAEQAVIAIRSAETYRALQERTVALGQRNREYGEQIEHQTATIDVLKAMSASPGNPQPVFDLIVERARELCDAYGATVYEFDGTQVHWRAATGVSDDPAIWAAYHAQFPMAPTREWHFGRAILDRQLTRIDDMESDSGLDPTLRGITAKSNVTTPIMRGDAVIGAIGMGSREKGGFSDSQIELLKTFGEQAAIAITSAETYRALQERTADLQESLEQQIATAEVLQVINASPGNLAPVFEAILEKAHRICRFDHGALALFDGTHFRSVATRGYGAAGDAVTRVPYRPSGAQRLVLRGARYGHIPDVLAFAAEPDDTVFTDWIALSGFRATLLVPLRKDGTVVGHLSGWRREVGAFSDKEIALLENFAAQAVIAMDNARLLTEQREALEQQTATAEVLQVINSSPGNLTPVFDAILIKAMDLCGAAFGSLYTYDGENFHSVAQRGMPEPYKVFRAQNPPNMTTGGPIAWLIETKRPVQVTDVTQSGLPGLRAMAELGGVRTVLTIPLVKDNELRGIFSVFRQEVRAFSDKDISLLENFAAQAVIAMENARLLTELRARTDELGARNSDFAERIDQQAATIDVLKVMSASPGDPQPVFDLIVRRAAELCNGAAAVLLEYDGTLVHYRARQGLDAHSAAAKEAADAYRNMYPMAPSRALNSHRAILDRQICHIRDVEAAPDSTIEGTRIIDVRSELHVPLLRDGASIGVMMLVSQHVGGFSDSQVELLQTFAEQAVIAIGAAAAFRALQQRTAELAQRQEELRTTFENMHDGVALFDVAHRLLAWNTNFPRILDLPDDALTQGLTFADYIRTLAERGEYGEGADPEAQVARVLALTGQRRAFERARPGGRIVEVRNNPVAGGGFVLIYADITDRKRAEAEIAAARDAAEQAARTIEAAYRDLKLPRPTSFRRKRWPPSASSPPASPTRSRIRSTSSTTSPPSRPSSSMSCARCWRPNRSSAPCVPRSTN
jgi:GAF domain-containing protein